MFKITFKPISICHCGNLCYNQMMIITESCEVQVTWGQIQQNLYRLFNSSTELVKTVLQLWELNPLLHNYYIISKEFKVSLELARACLNTKEEEIIHLQTRRLIVVGFFSPAQFWICIFFSLYQFLKGNSNSLSALRRADFLCKLQLLLKANQQFHLQHFWTLYDKSRKNH